MNATRRSGELPDRVVAAGLGQEAQRLRRRGRRTAGRSRSRPVSVSAKTLAGRPRPRVARRATLLARLDGALARPGGRGGGVRRPASGRAARPGRPRCEGPLLEDRPGHALARRRVARRTATGVWRIPQHQCAVNALAPSSKATLSRLTRRCGA